MKKSKCSITKRLLLHDSWKDRHIGTTEKESLGDKNIACHFLDYGVSTLTLKNL